MIGRRWPRALLGLCSAGLLMGAWRFSGAGGSVAGEPAAPLAVVAPAPQEGREARAERHGTRAVGDRVSAGDALEAAERAAADSAKRAMVRRAAVKLQAGRYNAFFNEEAHLAELAREEGAVDALRAELQDTGELEALPASVKFMQDEPRAVLDRAAMIDTLEALAQTRVDAAAALTEIAVSPIDSALPDHVKRAILGEKYDIFVALTRNDWTTARTAFAELDSDALRNVLRPALVGGLVDSGVSREDATQMTEHL